MVEEDERYSAVRVGVVKSKWCQKAKALGPHPFYRHLERRHNIESRQKKDLAQMIFI